MGHPEHVRWVCPTLWSFLFRCCSKDVLIMSKRVCEIRVLIPFSTAHHELEKKNEKRRMRKGGKEGRTLAAETEAERVRERERERLRLRE